MRFACPHCGQHLRSEHDVRGLQIVCPACSRAFLVPEGTPAEPARTVGAGTGDATSESPAASRPGGAVPQGREVPPAEGVRPPPVPAGAGSATPPPLVPRAEAASSGAGAPPPPASGSPPAGRHPAAAGRDFLRAGALAVIATVVFYAPVLAFGRGTYVGGLLADRGWVQYAIVLLTFWTAVVLLMRTRRLRLERKALAADLLPSEPAPFSARITPDNAAAYSVFLERQWGSLRGTLVYGRIAGALSAFRSGRTAAEVMRIAESQSDSDAGSIEATYAMLRVFVWAIPILGFIGTVIGIGAAVGGFSEAIQSAQELDVIKGALGQVTTGLAVAFDTTFLALIASIVLMFPISSRQSAEENLVAEVDAYCSERLTTRLADRQPAGAERREELTPEAIGASVSAALQAALRQHSEGLSGFLARLGKRAEAAATVVTTALEASLREQSEQSSAFLSQLAERCRENAAGMTAAMETALRRQTERTSALFSQMDQRIEKAAAGLTAAVDAALQRHKDGTAAFLDQLRRQSEETAGRVAQSWKETQEGIAAGLAGLQAEFQEQQRHFLRDSESLTAHSLSEQKALLEDVLKAHREEQARLTETLQSASFAQHQLSAMQETYGETLGNLTRALAEDLTTLQRSAAAAREAETAQLRGMSDHLIQALARVETAAAGAQSSLQGVAAGLARLDDGGAREFAAALRDSAAAVQERLGERVGQYVEALRETAQDLARASAEGLRRQEEQTAQTQALAAEGLRRLAESNEKAAAAFEGSLRSLAAAVGSLDQRLEALQSGQGALAAMERQMAEHLKQWRSSVSFERTLHGLQQVLARLSAAPGGESA